MLSAGSQTVLPTVRFSPATTVVFTTAANMGYRTLQRWVAQYRATESVAPRPRGGGWRSPIVIVVLPALVRERPAGTSHELCREYNRRMRRAARTSEASFRRALAREGYVIKKTAASE